MTLLRTTQDDSSGKGKDKILGMDSVAERRGLVALDVLTQKEKKKWGPKMTETKSANLGLQKERPNPDRKCEEITNLLRMVAHPCNSSTWKAETGGDRSGV